ncbi:MAG: hypothetical protein AB2L09_08730 [Coriobacteriia bacterium]
MLMLRSIEQLLDILQRFDIEESERMLYYQLRALGITRAAQIPNKTTKKGRVALYDEFVVWLVASAYYGESEPSLLNPSFGVGTYESLAREALDEDADEDRIRILAYWLMITGPEYGMRIGKLRELLNRDPSLLDLAPGSRAGKLLAFEAYKNTHVDLVMQMEKRPLLSEDRHYPPADEWTLEQKRQLFAVRVLPALVEAGVADKTFTDD